MANAFLVHLSVAALCGMVSATMIAASLNSRTRTVAVVSTVAMLVPAALTFSNHIAAATFMATFIVTMLPAVFVVHGRTNGAT